MKRTLLFLFILLFEIIGISAEAQTGQIVLNPGMTMVPNPSCYVSDWQSNPQTIMLSVLMTEQCNFPVKLMAKAMRDGETIAQTNPSKVEIISFHFGTNTFNAAQIIPLRAVEFPTAIDETTKRLGRLPEGDYSLCVWFINAQTGQPLPGSACSPFTIQDVNPPTLISPAIGSTWSLSPQEARQAQLGLNFQWTPPMPMSTARVEYKIRIVPVLTGQTPQQALATYTQSAEQRGLFVTQFNGGDFMRSRYIDFLSRNETSTFAWAVQANDAQGNGIGKNNGWSEVHTFTVSDFFDIFAEVDSPKTGGANGGTVKVDSPAVNNGGVVIIKKEPCGLHAKLVDTKFGPWKLFKSYSQYFNIWIRNVYNIYEVIDCGLEKGHAGPHHGSTHKVYVLDHTEKQKMYDTKEPDPTPPASMGDEPSKKDQMSKEDINKILDK